MGPSSMLPGISGPAPTASPGASPYDAILAELEANRQSPLPVNTPGALPTVLTTLLSAIGAGFGGDPRLGLGVLSQQFQQAREAEEKNRAMAREDFMTALKLKLEKIGAQREDKQQKSRTELEERRIAGAEAAQMERERHNQAIEALEARRIQAMLDKEGHGPDLAGSLLTYALQSFDASVRDADAVDDKLRAEGYTEEALNSAIKETRESINRLERQKVMGASAGSKALIDSFDNTIKYVYGPRLSEYEQLLQELQKEMLDQKKRRAADKKRLGEIQNPRQAKREAVNRAVGMTVR
jgi:hypothetical protein